MEVRLLFVDAAGNLGKNIGGVLIAKSSGLVDRLAGAVTESGECRGQRREVRLLGVDAELVSFPFGTTHRVALPGHECGDLGPPSPAPAGCFGPPT